MVITDIGSYSDTVPETQITVSGMELYMPMIEHNSYLYGRLDEDLKQCIFIHIALNISKFKI